MQFEILSKRAEELLKEIIEHRNDNGVCDVEYWQEKLESLCNEDETRLRNLFGELAAAEMVFVAWADNTVWYLDIQEKGYSYFEEKKRNKKAQWKSNGSSFLRDLALVLIGAVAGGIVEYLLFIVWGIGG